MFVLSVLITTFGFSSLLPPAYAQDVTIETSAGNHDNRLFGEALLQVTIKADDEDNSIQETVSVDIDADGDTSTDGTFEIPETSASSSKYEFFLVHVDSGFAPDGADIDADNPLGTEDYAATTLQAAGSKEAPMIDFGAGAAELDTGAGLYDDVSFDITLDDETVTVDYEETSGTLELDRLSYGSTSYVYITVNDQDANLNPTESDEFTVDPDADPNDDLLELNGGTFEDAVVFEETGDNTGVFEGRYRLGVSIDANAEALVLKLHEKANYNADLDAQENDSNETDEVSFTIGNSDGTIDVGSGEQQITTFDPTIATDKESYTEGETVQLTITDQDANINSGLVDSIKAKISSGSSEIEVSPLETSVNSGIFEASFMLASETNSTESKMVVSKNVTIMYTDDRPADFSESIEAGKNPEKDFGLAIDVQITVKTGIATTDVAAPIAKNMAGSSGPFLVGTSLALSTTVTNNNNAQQPFVALIEVRDSNDVTVFLSWQSGTLEPRGTTDIAVSWLPYNIGTYQIRTFTLSSIGTEGVEVLSPVAMSDTIVR